MKVRNVYIENINLISVTEEIVGLLIRNNISHVLIKESDYIELHFLDFIYRFSFSKEASLPNKHYASIMQLSELELLNISCKEIADYKNKNSFVDISTPSYKRKKERPGFKRYTKKDMKREKNKYRIT